MNEETFPALTPEQEDKRAKFCLNANRGAYSDRELKNFGYAANDDMPIKNLEERHVKKNPELGSKGH